MASRTQYFRKFPFIDYNGRIGVNITRRAAINENVKNFLTAFYTYTIPNSDRIEHVAYDYYNDINLDWLIYHANDIIDPYYQVSRNIEEFNNFIIDKYGSLRLARRKTIHYKNNYEGDTNTITTAAYQALSKEQKKYYQPVQNERGTIAYERAKIDFIISTNKIETFDVLNVSGTFRKNEVIVRDGDSTTFAEVSSVANTNLIIQHVRGDFSANTNYTITGEESGATATVNANSFQLLSSVVSTDEQVYYSPISFYDYEEQLNEDRREIFLVDNIYSTTLNEQLTEIMRQ